MAVLWTSNVLDEVTQFLAQRSENFVFVFNRL